MTEAEREKLRRIAEDHGTDRTAAAVDRIEARRRLAEALGCSPILLLDEDRIHSDIGIRAARWRRARQQISELADLEIHDPTVGEALDWMTDAVPLARVGPSPEFESEITEADAGGTDWFFWSVVAVAFIAVVVAWAK